MILALAASMRRTLRRIAEFSGRGGSGKLFVGGGLDCCRGAAAGRIEVLVGPVFLEDLLGARSLP